MWSSRPCYMSEIPYTRVNHAVYASCRSISLAIPSLWGLCVIIIFIIIGLFPLFTQSVRHVCRMMGCMKYERGALCIPHIHTHAHPLSLYFLSSFILSGLQ